MPRPPLVGEQLGKSVLRMIADVFEDVVQVGERVDGEPLGGGDQAGEHGRPGRFHNEAHLRRLVRVRIRDYLADCMNNSPGFISKVLATMVRGKESDCSLRGSLARFVSRPER